MVDQARIDAHVKRFRDCVIGDDRFRAALAAGPSAATAAAGLEVDPEALAHVWREGGRIDPESPEATGERRLGERFRRYLAFIADDAGAMGPYRRWRARQRARADLALGYATGPFALHVPFAIELTRGCSLGCWFCGVSARPLDAVLPTDLVNWESMLRVLRAVFGVSGARGVLYCATEPLDHPEYEAHGEVFRKVFGRFPATTTAAQLADPARTARLMALSRAGASPALRFSVVSRKELLRLHETFSPEELVDVDLALVNRESLLALADAGRARGKARRMEVEYRKWRRAVADDAVRHTTIACVSGFLVEPLNHRVRLVTPEPATGRWPDGYAVLDEELFDDVETFGHALDRLIERNMRPTPPDRLALQRGVTVEALPAGGVRARSPGHAITLAARGRSHGHLPGLAREFAAPQPVEDAVAAVSRRSGIPRSLLRLDVTALWRHGVLVEPAFGLAGGGTP